MGFRFKLKLGEPQQGWPLPPGGRASPLPSAPADRGQWAGPEPQPRLAPPWPVTMAPGLWWAGKWPCWPAPVAILMLLLLLPLVSVTTSLSVLLHSAAERPLPREMEGQASVSLSSMIT